MPNGLYDTNLFNIELKKINAAFSSSVACNSIALNSTLQDKSLSREDGALSLTWFQLVPWIFS